jgi:predicted SAM-dependent methyltransferase
MLKLNLGAGDVEIPGHVPIDRKLGHEVYPLPANVIVGHERVNLTDGSVDEVRASHVLEHFSHRQTADVLREWVRVLKPGGVLKVAVPDFDRITDWYVGGRTHLPLEGYLFGGHCDANDHHGAMFNRGKLTELMENAGLVSVTDWQSEAQDCASLPVSLNLMGTKPAEPVKTKVRVRCAMSVPRLGWQDNFFCWAQALLPLGISPVKFSGAFWGQCLERVMEQLLAEDPDYILTIDYDTLFNRADVQALLRLMTFHPEVDAIAPVQMKRGGGAAMACLRDADGNPIEHVPAAEFAKDLMRVDSGHFGLTLIRASKLRAMPHPWFLGVPNEQGEWGEGRLDDDIYFWDRWKKAGNTLYLANRVPVGHLEVVATWPDRQLNTLYAKPDDYYETKRPPAEAWR